jgi:hypothetical protein
MKHIFKTIYNFKDIRIFYPYPSNWDLIKWHAARGIRNMTIVTAFVLCSTASAAVYHELSPKLVYADRKVEVPIQPDIPILTKICNAESGGKQFNSDGSVVRGKVNPSDIGICQINEPTWNDRARKLGFDIYTQDGNEAMAQWIFLNYGDIPWSASKAGWNK